MAPSPAAAGGPELDCKVNWQSPRNRTKVEPRAEFTVRWNVTNTGSAAWDPGVVDLAYSGGTRMYYEPVIPLTQVVAPGEDVTLTVDMKALRDTRSYATSWALRRDDTYFCDLGVRIYVQWVGGLERKE